MRDLLLGLGLDVAAHPWLPEVLLVLLAVPAINLAVHYLLRHAERLTGRTRTVWDDALLRALDRPLRLVVWLLALAYAGERIARQAQLEALAAVPLLRDVGVVLGLAWFMIRLIHAVSDNLIARARAAGEEVDHTTVDALSKLARLLVLVLAGLLVLQTLGVSIAGLLAAGGIGGIAIGFAAKDLLANFFGGLTIYLDRPFAVGEWIRSPDKDIEGTVEYISWRHTRIRRFNKNPLYVPNALFTTIVLENPSRMSHRRIKETLGLRYADLDKMAAIVAEVEAMLRSHPDIDGNQALVVSFNAFNASSLDFFLCAYTPIRDWAPYQALKQEILLRVAGIVHRHGGDFAYPTRTVRLDNLTPASGDTG